MRIQLEGVDLPGMSGIGVAVQRKDRPGELLDLQPGDAKTVSWTLECTHAAIVDGKLDARGPHIQGGPGQRFIYLSWGEIHGDGSFHMFRRAKLWLDGVDAETARAAIDSGCLHGTLGLTDAKGQPLCASVRPPKIRWSA